MIFKWDEEKNASNIKEHHLSFTTAIKVFSDPNRVVIFDEEHSTAFEDRYITIGYINTTPIFIVYTVIDDETIRIISARKATRTEENLYYNQ